MYEVHLTRVRLLLGSFLFIGLAQVRLLDSYYDSFYRSIFFILL